MTPEQISKILREDVKHNNGLLYEDELEEGWGQNLAMSAALLGGGAALAQDQLSSTDAKTVAQVTPRPNTYKPTKPTKPIGKPAAKPTFESLVADGDACFAEGSKLFKQYRPGTDDNNGVLQKALEFLNKAVDTYGSALEIKSDARVLKQQLEASQMSYSCRKYQTL